MLKFLYRWLGYLWWEVLEVSFERDASKEIRHFHISSVIQKAPRHASLKYVYMAVISVSMWCICMYLCMYVCMYARMYNSMHLFSCT